MGRRAPSRVAAGCIARFGTCERFHIVGVGRVEDSTGTSSYGDRGTVEWATDLPLEHGQYQEDFKVICAGVECIGDMKCDIY